MSDATKIKLSEHHKRFSICKLCSKQCRGFRGLVDHMHRDHQDYKPWSCHLCNEKTTFVKTLYRHLKKEHDSPGTDCSVCGKFFSRAQSMLQHFKQQVSPSEWRGHFYLVIFSMRQKTLRSNWQQVKVEVVTLHLVVFTNRPARLRRILKNQPKSVETMRILSTC